MVKVKALVRLYVGGRIYPPGTEFEVDERTAKALGASVKVLKSPPKDKAIKQTKAK